MKCVDVIVNCAKNVVSPADFFVFEQQISFKFQFTQREICLNKLERSVGVFLLETTSSIVVSFIFTGLVSQKPNLTQKQCILYYKI